MSKAIRADFDEVTRALREAVAPLDGACEAVPLLEAQGRILSESVAAQFNFPHFDNSAMDGFALRTATCLRRTPSSFPSAASQLLAILLKSPFPRAPHCAS